MMSFWGAGPASVRLPCPRDGTALYADPREQAQTAWPTYVRNIHGAPDVFLELKEG